MLKRLRTAGFQIESVNTLKIKGTKNSNLLQFALKNQNILITHDHNYAYPNLTSHFGILIVMIHPATDDVAGTELERFLITGHIDDLRDKITILKK